MSAKLHKSMAVGRLVMRNRIIGEVMLDYVTADGKRESACIHPLSKPIDLLKIADMDSWKRGNLAATVRLRHIDVVL